MVKFNRMNQNLFNDQINYTLYLGIRALKWERFEEKSLVLKNFYKGEL